MVKGLFSALCRGSAALASLLITFSVSAGPLQGLLDSAHAKVRAVRAVQEQVTAEWIKKPGVLGTAVGLGATGAPALVIYVDRDEENVGDIIRSFPFKERDAEVRVEVTDKFRALARRSGGGGGVSHVSHTAEQTPPIQLGTSGGWSKDLANGYCCGGTLGSLVSIGGVQYILSCYHVLEGDIVPGGNGTVAMTGDPVIQPGLIDVGCMAAYAQTVATLVKRSSLPTSNVDVATAQVIPGMVSSSILEIGTISSSTVGAALGQAVKKSGRTTGLTRSAVSGLNATINVTYDNECAGGIAFTKTFTGQIVISNRSSTFLNSGDSGSLMVEDASTNPRAVGLLYAGSSTLAVANPIDEVLSFLSASAGGAGATMVGTP